MPMFVVGQCWMSRAEPELGLGFISEADKRTVTIFFPGGSVVRKYGTSMAPIQRVQFKIGDKLQTKDGVKFRVEEVHEVEGLIIYASGDEMVPETQLADEISFSKPEERLLNGQVDPLRAFHLRQEALKLQQRLLSSTVRGFIGPRVELLPHQIYVATEIAKRAFPRVLLADEVGLGKTIEAGLILHHLMLTGKAERILIAAPRSLTHQWFVEMYRRYNLSFGVLNSEQDFEGEENPFAERQIHIISLELLTGVDEAARAALTSRWDLVIVDEAHRLKWSLDKVSREFGIVQALAENTAGLLLLTATPEQLGLEGHFARLQLLDPNRFPSYEVFKEETSKYKQLADQLDAKAGEVELVRELVDRHGTGRVLFRNSRRSLATNDFNFPKRQLKSYSLEATKGQSSDDVKLVWLKDFLKDVGDKKVLLISRTREQADWLHENLQGLPDMTSATFHSGLSLMDRDRQAASFCEPDGIQLLLCSEIGSEGRNFQHSQDVVFFDLPEHPDLLEQRIGRLDRIGQKSDIIIHVPYVKNSGDEVLYSWFHEGLNAFTEPTRGAQQLMQQFREQLRGLIEAFGDDISDKQRSELKKLIKETKKASQMIRDKLEDGRDRLLEINSFDAKQAAAMIDMINAENAGQSLMSFMSRVFELMGVSDEPVTSTISFIQPTEKMRFSQFPELPAQGRLITFDRETALKRGDTTLLSWDHPMVVGILDMLTSQEYGNVTLSRWRSPQETLRDQSLPVFEAHYLVNFVAPKKLHATEYFPPTLLRVVLDAQGRDVSTNWPEDKLKLAIKPAKGMHIRQIGNFPKDKLRELIEKGKAQVTPEAKAIQQQYEQRMIEAHEAEVQRLVMLKEKNNMVRDEEIQYFVDKQALLLEVARKSELSLDSFQLIIS